MVGIAAGELDDQALLAPDAVRLDSLVADLAASSFRAVRRGS
jgi:hypothetical protein